MRSRRTGCRAGSRGRRSGPGIGACWSRTWSRPAAQRSEHHDIHVQRARTAEIGKLTTVISRLGGPGRLKPCGEPLTRLEYQTVLAWNLHVDVATVGYRYGPAIASSRAIVLFTPYPHGGWLVQALHQQVARCRSLPS